MKYEESAEIFEYFFVLVFIIIPFRHIRMGKFDEIQKKVRDLHCMAPRKKKIRFFF